MDSVKVCCCCCCCLALRVAGWNQLTSPTFASEALIKNAQWLLADTLFSTENDVAGFFRACDTLQTRRLWRRFTRVRVQVVRAVDDAAGIISCVVAGNHPRRTHTIEGLTRPRWRAWCKVHDWHLANITPARSPRRFNRSFPIFDIIVHTPSKVLDTLILVDLSMKRRLNAYRARHFGALLHLLSHTQLLHSSSPPPQHQTSSLYTALFPSHLQSIYLSILTGCSKSKSQEAVRIQV